MSTPAKGRRHEGGTAFGRYAAGDAKRLALPRRLAYYRPNKERDQGVSAAGADDHSLLLLGSTPCRRPLRRFGCRRFVGAFFIPSINAKEVQPREMVRMTRGNTD